MYNDTSIVGKGLPLREGYTKVTGMERFAPDRGLAGALWMKILRSPYAHANIKNIDVTKAEALSGVIAILTHKDVPLKEISDHFAWQGRALADRVRFVGDEVAAVAAVSEKIAEEALDLIQVEYEELPTVFDMEEALKPDAPDIRGVGTNRASSPPDPGFVMQSPQEWGDIEQGFAAADAAIECGLTTQSIYGAFFPPACIAEWYGDKLTLMISHQGPFQLRNWLCQALDIPEHRVRIIAPLVSAAMGMLNSVQKFWHIAALLARKSGRPIIYKMTLEEYGVYKSREPSTFRVKMAGKKDGTITALDWDQIHDNGAYGQRTTTIGTMHDLLPRANVRYTHCGASTNKLTPADIRGVGDVSQAQAINQAVDMLAEKLGLDPLLVWKKNHMRAGDPRRALDLLAKLTLTTEAYDEMIDKGAKAIEWEKKWKGWAKPYETSGSKKRAIGMAVGLHVSGVPIIPAASTIRINHDGTAHVSAGTMELGQGCKTTYAQIAAELMGFKFEDVYVVKDVDTETTPHAPVTGGSGSLHIEGSAVKVAALDAKKQLLEQAHTASWSPNRLKGGIEKPEDLDIKDSMIYVKADPSKRAAIKEVLSHFGPMIIGRGSRHDLPVPGPAPYITAVGFADVEVDEETGAVNILKLVQCNDSGRIINPEICENQIYGGTLMSLGYALMEEIAFDPMTGKPLNPALTDYWAPTSLDTPPMDVIFSENIDPLGPLGAKGIGEATAICPHPAIASAIYNAIGVRIDKLPITPDKILHALGKLK